MRKMGLGLHGVIDYFIAGVLIIGPVVFSIDDGWARWSAIAAGVVLLISNLMTDSPAGLSKHISTETHMLLDLCLGLALIMSRWLLGFSSEHAMIHLLTGLSLILSSLLTCAKPARLVSNQRRRKLHKPVLRTFSIR